MMLKFLIVSLQIHRDHYASQRSDVSAPAVRKFSDRSKPFPTCDKNLRVITGFEYFFMILSSFSMMTRMQRGMLVEMLSRTGCPESSEIGHHVFVESSILRSSSQLLRLFLAVCLGMCGMCFCSVLPRFGATVRRARSEGRKTNELCYLFAVNIWWCREEIQRSETSANITASDVQIDGRTHRGRTLLGPASRSPDE